MSDRDYNEFVRISGRLMKQAMQVRIADPAWRSMTGEERRKAFDAEKTAARKAAQRMLGLASGDNGEKGAVPPPPPGYVLQPHDATPVAGDKPPSFLGGDWLAGRAIEKQGERRMMSHEEWDYWQGEPLLARRRELGTLSQRLGPPSTNFIDRTGGGDARRMRELLSFLNWYGIEGPPALLTPTNRGGAQGGGLFGRRGGW